MPQFDKITFFNQIFWLFFFFSSFYLVLLKIFLPKLSSVLKARTKKLQKGIEGALIFSNEQDSATNLFNASLEEISAVAKTSIIKTTSEEDSIIKQESFKMETLNRSPYGIATSNDALERAVHSQAGTFFLSLHPQIVDEDLSFSGS